MIYNISNLFREFLMLSANGHLKLNTGTVLGTFMQTGRRSSTKGLPVKVLEVC